MVLPEIADRVAALIGGADRAVVLTGAGMSAESGVPTFRDALTGYWSTFDPGGPWLFTGGDAKRRWFASPSR